MLFGPDAILNNFPVFIAGVIALVVSIGFHEFSHVFVANSLGDPTGRLAGRLTLNPIKHLDPIGTLMILSGFFIGWGRPAPFNPQNLRYGTFGPALVALGGPVSNLLMLVASSVLLRLVYPSLGPENLFTILVQILVLMNASLLLFNLIPLPPLDGSWILLALLPPAHPLKSFLERYGWGLMLAVIVLDFGLRIRIISPFIINGISWLADVLGIAPLLI